MTNEEINIAIAESMGWDVAFDTLCNITPDHNGEPVIEPIEPLPNYTSDLNACHEFEKVLYIQNETAQQAQKRVFYEMLLYDFDNHPIHATARQRCVAYLRTIGKWKE